MNESNAFLREFDTKMAAAFRAGQDANDHNHRVWRTGDGDVWHNPYPSDTEEHKRWRDGYKYRDMVNDG